MIATASRQQLRDYQERAVETVIEKLGSRPILVSPTGSGKTTMATEIVERLGLPTLWLAHRKELIDQAAGYKPGWSYYRFFDRFGVAPIVAGGELVDPPAASPDQKAEVYREFLRLAAIKGYKPGWAAYRFRDAFGHWPPRIDPRSGGSEP